MAERHPCKELHDKFQELNGLAGIAASNAKVAHQNKAWNVSELQTVADQLKRNANDMHQLYEDCVEVHGHF